MRLLMGAWIYVVLNRLNSFSEALGLYANYYVSVYGQKMNFLTMSALFYLLARRYSE